LEKLVILKMGGSVITNKRIPMAVNLEALDALSVAVSQASTNLLIVHGGGSFGHYYAKQFGLGTELKAVSREGVAKTRSAMLQLNIIVTKILEKQGVYAYSLPPASLVGFGRVAAHGAELLESIMEGGLVPITYGDVLPNHGRYNILSGDSITRMLALCLKADRVVFTSDVDGLYASGNKLVRSIGIRDKFAIDQPDRGLDVTGGMALKLCEAQEIARNGVDVYFVNGLKPERVIKALKGEIVEGSLIRGTRNAR
jgi:isopentenyl phosphate kinase